MRFLLSIAFLLISAHSVWAQKPVPENYAAIDRKALELPQSLAQNTDQIAGYINTHFKTDLEKARAAFIWTATNIQYDVENMFAINFYEKKSEKIEKALQTGKGICGNYAALFTDICIKAGVKSYVIEGYTKQNGFADYIPHAWSAARIDTSWYLFDPTWGSGYLKDGQFFRKINNNYFKVSPATFVKSHMPFDYLWQFLQYPVTNGEFVSGKTGLDAAKPVFNFKDSLQAYERLDTIEQVAAAAYRVEKNGVRNALVFDRLRHLRAQIENDRQTQTTTLYNTAVADFNEAIRIFNTYISFKNKQFTPAKTDREIQDILNEADSRLKAGGEKLARITAPDANVAALTKQLQASISDASKQFAEEQAWLKTYLGKDKLRRKAMFYKRVDLFGKPVN